MFDPKLKEALGRVQKPGRYTGGEPGSVYKDKNNVDVRFAFCFPDTYEVGMSFLGEKILYELLNSHENWWCERAFMPWLDMKAEMERLQLPLYTMESKDPLTDFDAVGFTLQYELSYTNILAMLDLAGIPLRAATVTAQVTIIIVVTYLTIIFGELVPKRIGMNAAEKAAKIVARPMRALSVVTSPFVWLLSKSTAGGTRLLGLHKAESKVTEAEIRSIIQEGAEDGEVQEVEQKIMGRVFSLGDRTVESIMTHRSDLVWIDVSMTADEIREVVARAPHNRYPVGDGNLDKLLGVVYLKDLFLHLNTPTFDLRTLLTPGKFFHEGFEVYNALEQLRSEQLGYGIICDEFGVTRGIITLKDIFEALVGELPDPREEPDIVRRDDGSCLVDGQCPYYDFLAWFGLEEVFPHNAYNTVSGLILEQLAHIPATGEKLSWNGFTFEIVDMDGARIDKVLVTFDQQEQL